MATGLPPAMFPPPSGPVVPPGASPVPPGPAPAEPIETLSPSPVLPVQIPGSYTPPAPRRAGFVAEPLAPSDRGFGRTFGPRLGPNGNPIGIVAGPPAIVDPIQIDPEVPGGFFTPPGPGYEPRDPATGIPHPPPPPAPDVHPMRDPATGLPHPTFNPDVPVPIYNPSDPRYVPTSRDPDPPFFTPTPGPGDPTGFAYSLGDGSSQQESIAAPNWGNLAMVAAAVFVAFLVLRRG